VAAAKAAGLQWWFTDHHLPAEQLPAADAIVQSQPAWLCIPQQGISPSRVDLLCI